jgi:hypothetical protein
MPIPSEFDIQRAYVMWFNGVPGKIEPAKRPGVVGFHVPNGGTRNAFEGKRLKQSGVLPGVPDWCMLFGRCFFIEFKKPGGSLSAAQIELHPRLIAAGAWIATVDSLEAAKAQTRAWDLSLPNR